MSDTENIKKTRKRWEKSKRKNCEKKEEGGDFLSSSYKIEAMLYEGCCLLTLHQLWNLILTLWFVLVSFVKGKPENYEKNCKI